MPHEKIVEGWPLDSLSKDIKTGKYCHDIEPLGNNIHPIIGIKAEVEIIKILKEVLENIKK